MRILICDEDTRVLSDLSKCIKRIFNEVKPDENLNVVTFSSTFAMEDYIETKQINVDGIFMDIALGENGKNNGVDVAKRIKEEHPNINIVFHTSNVEYAEAIFDVEPLWLLLKPASDERIKKVLYKLINAVETNECITVRKVGAIIRIKSDDISYIESSGKYVKIYTNNDCIATISQLDKIGAELNEMFVRCHKSYIVNIRKVKQFEYNKIILFDDTEILVSRSYKTAIKEMLLS